MSTESEGTVTTDTERCPGCGAADPMGDEGAWHRNDCPVVYDTESSAGRQHFIDTGHYLQRFETQPPPIYLAHRGNAFALDESGRFLLNAPVSADGTIEREEWTEINPNLLPDATNEALRKIYGALLTVPQEVPAP